MIYYDDILKVIRYQHWFRKFSSGDFHLSDSGQSRRPVEFDNDPEITMTLKHNELEITGRAGFMIEYPSNS